MDGTWRTLVTPPLSGAANMALDHALMERARRTGERVFRVYSWSQPTLSLGRHQMSRNRINTGAARELGVALVRRPTGGRALLHHREVTYSVTTALSRHDSVRGWYASISSVLLDALRLLGVKAETATPAGRTPYQPRRHVSYSPMTGKSRSTAESWWEVRCCVSRTPCCSTARSCLMTISRC